jgi:hypothetical protein
MRLIIPVAGQSSRFPNIRPKWMLTHPKGNLMIAESFRNWETDNIEEIIIICLREHEQKYGVQSMLGKQFKKLGLSDRLKIVVIEASESQPHTVYQGIQSAKVSGPIFIKDSDNYFLHTPTPGNMVCYAPLRELKRGKPANKSYVLLNEVGLVLNIVEKRIISDSFCTGGYGFAKAEEFASTFEKLRDVPNLYVSHVIYQMILDGHPFAGVRVKGFVDWGTLKDWNDYRAQFCTLFVDLDGVLVENSAEYFSPFWGSTKGIEANVAAINRLFDSGYGEIIITTTRSPDTDEITRQQLDMIGLRYHRIVFGLQHSKRIVINDFSRTNPYRSCDAINLSRNSDQLSEMLSYFVAMPDEET